MDKDKVEVPLRVAIYLRVSTDEQAEKYGLGAQRSAVEGVIKSRGKLDNGSDVAVFAGENYVYIDDGVSGADELDERPAFTRLKEDIVHAQDGQKPFDVVAVYKIDRFARKLRILMDVLKFFDQRGIEFISATESIDTSTPFGRAMLGIMGVIAELELETIKERTQRGREQAIIEGVFMGANTPYGYQKDPKGHLIRLDEEAEVVERIFSLFTVENRSPQGIAEILTEREILSPDASAVKHNKRKGVSKKTNLPHFWRAEKIREILSNDVYTGIRYYGKFIKGKTIDRNEWKESPFRHELIVPFPIFELAQQRLKELSERRTLNAKKLSGHTYLLSALLKCDHCKELDEEGKPQMISWTGGKKKINSSPQEYSYYYYCNRKNRTKFSKLCQVVPIPAGALEDYIKDFIRQLLSDPKSVYVYQKQLASNQLNIKRLTSDRKVYTGLLNGLPKRRQSLRDQQEMGAIDSPTLQRKFEELKGKETEYKSKLIEIDDNLSHETISKGYQESFEQYAEKYGKSLEIVMRDEKQLYDLIHTLLHEIVVYSRPRTEKDIIAGRKKEGQFIPDRIDISFNLPQNLLRELYMQEFGVKSDNL